MSEKNEEDERSLAELEGDRKEGVAAVMGALSFLLFVGVLLGLVGACIALQAGEEKQLKLGGGIVGAAGLMFSASLIAVFHFALGWQKFRTLMTVIMMLVFMGVVGGLVKFLVATKPEAKKVEEQVKIIPVVKVIEVRPAKGGVEIEAEGVVESQRVVSLTAEISGKLIRVNQKLVPGGTVSRDEILVEIEPADYRAALDQAKAVKQRAKMSVADAQLALAQEVARREQALRDWRELGQGKPSALLERKPQLTSAEARLASARADVELSLIHI